MKNGKPTSPVGRWNDLYHGTVEDITITHLTCDDRPVTGTGETPPAHRSGLL